MTRVVRYSRRHPRLGRLAAPAANVGPTASFTFTTDGLQATFTDTSTDPDGTIVAWAWAWSGGTSTARNPVITFPSAGTYDVTLTVTDDDGATDDHTASVTVAEENILPAASFTYEAAAVPQRQFPESAEAWDAAFPDVATPDHIWTFQEASGNVIDQVGSADLTPNATFDYQVLGDPEPTLNPRYTIKTKTTDVSERFDSADTSLGDPSSSFSLYFRFVSPDNGSTQRALMGKGGNNTNNSWTVYRKSSGEIVFRTQGNAGEVSFRETASTYDDGNYHDVLIVVDQSLNTISLYVDEESLSTALDGHAAIANASAVLRFFVSSGTTGLAGTGISYAAYWSDVLDGDDLDTIRSEIGQAGAGAGDGFTQKIAIPSYFYPSSSGSGGALWNQVNAKGATVAIALFNPASGPGNSADSNYLARLALAQAAGQKVCGYITTNYRDTGGVQSDGIPRDLANIANVKAQIDDWYDFYPDLDGIFCDEMNNDGDADDLDYYGQIYDYIKAKDAAALVIQNPGSSFPENMIDLADIFMRRETNKTNYLAATPTAWHDSYPPTKFWDCIHTTPDADWQDVLEVARTRKAGYVYITDDVMPNPYNTLPTYWNDLVAAIETLNGDGGEHGVIFTDASTDADGTIVAWHWDFGDGESSTQRHPTHYYASAGTYTVTLTVTDDDGGSHAHSEEVEVA